MIALWNPGFGLGIVAMELGLYVSVNAQFWMCSEVRTYIPQPPEIGISAPVRYEDSLDKRKRIVGRMSWVVPSRPAGMASAI